MHCDRGKLGMQTVSLDRQRVSLSQVSMPMDLSTLLMRIDQRRYGTLAAFVADLQVIPTAATQYWANDPRGAREVPAASRSAQ